MDKENNEITLVSIITVSYNSSKTIEDTIKSILNQTYTNIEYIIVDGNSTDNTIDILKSSAKLFEIRNIDYRWISEPDKGIYDAMNKGIFMAKGDIIGIINSDDWYSDDAVIEAVKTLKNETFAIVSGERRKVKFNKKPYGVYYNKKEIKSYIHKVMPINHAATFVHNTVYEKVGVFDTRYKLSADYDFIYRAFNASVNFMFIDKIIVNMRNSGATGQLKNLSVTAKEDLHIRKKNKVKFAQFYYIKRLGFNILIIIRDTLRNMINKD